MSKLRRASDGQKPRKTGPMFWIHMHILQGIGCVVVVDFIESACRRESMDAALRISLALQRVAGSLELCAREAIKSTTPKGRVSSGRTRDGEAVAKVHRCESLPGGAGPEPVASYDFYSTTFRRHRKFQAVRGWSSFRRSHSVLEPNQVSHHTHPHVLCSSLRVGDIGLGIGR